MSKELNEKLKVNLLQTLDEYLPQCKESLMRNKHMHDFLTTTDWQPDLRQDGTAKWLAALVSKAIDNYKGEDRLIDVVNALVEDAKRWVRSGAYDAFTCEKTAILVDFLNYWASKRCMDLGLYAKDLREPEVKQSQPSPHMQQIELYTALFEYVATVEIPPFNKNPEVLLWGSRFFRALGHPVRDERDINAGTGHNRPTAYVECFAYASVTESPGIKRWEPPVPPPVDRDARAVVGKAVAPGVPDTTQREDGQHAGYVVLSDAERAKGFVRPVRDSYTHVGKKVCGKVDSEPSPLLPDEVAWLCNLAPEHDGTCCFSAVTEQQLKNFKRNGTLSGCNHVTSMGRELAETYARDPGFYGSTYCSTCKTHPPVGANGEFVWTTDPTVRVGT